MELWPYKPGLGQGLMETGDPVAGTERSEASAKNIEMLILTRHSALAGYEKVTHLLSYLTFVSRKISPVTHYSNCGAKRS
jgi:hypothetical protein